MRQHARTPVRISVECVLLYQVSLYIGGSKLRGRLGNNQPDYPSELLYWGAGLIRSHPHYYRRTLQKGPFVSGHLFLLAANSRASR